MLLTDTHLRSGESFLLANYISHRNDRLTERGGRDILVRLGIDHKAVTVQVLKHLEATATQDTMSSKRAKILVVYPSPSRPLIFRIDLPALVAVFPSSRRVT
jgi:spore coat polysaccharide biosynthesis predicted glycosyltransferase SpsG